ncbi:hypothetical protein RCH18_002004 [Flavobacterium sp. PL11]|nr:hypothetical protein [Flavobacterium sp. PL11]
MPSFLIDVNLPIIFLSGTLMNSYIIKTSMTNGQMKKYGIMQKKIISQ